MQLNNNLSIINQINERYPRIGTALQRTHDYLIYQFAPSALKLLNNDQLTMRTRNSLTVKIGSIVVLAVGLLSRRVSLLSLGIVSFAISSFVYSNIKKELKRRQILITANHLIERITQFNQQKQALYQQLGFNGNLEQCRFSTNAIDGREHLNAFQTNTDNIHHRWLELPNGHYPNFVNISLLQKSLRNISTLSHEQRQSRSQLLANFPQNLTHYETEHRTSTTNLHRQTLTTRDRLRLSDDNQTIRGTFQIEQEVTLSENHLRQGLTQIQNLSTRLEGLSGVLQLIVTTHQ